MMMMIIIIIIIIIILNDYIYTIYLYYTKLLINNEIIYLV